MPDCSLRPVFLRVIIVIHKCRNVSGSRRWEELSLLCHLDKIPPESKYPPPRFSLFLQDGNVHLKTSLLYCSYITQHSAPLSGRQVPIKSLIYGAWCIPWPWRAGSLAEIWDEMQRTHSKWISFQPASILQRCCKPSHLSNLRDFSPRSFLNISAMWPVCLFSMLRWETIKVTCIPDVIKLTKPPFVVGCSVQLSASQITLALKTTTFPCLLTCRKLHADVYKNREQHLLSRILFLLFVKWLFFAFAAKSCNQSKRL